VKLEKFCYCRSAHSLVSLASLHWVRFRLIIVNNILGIMIFLVFIPDQQVFFSFFFFFFVVLDISPYSVFVRVLFLVVHV
jgi:hypothetical protein